MSETLTAPPSDAPAPAPVPAPATADWRASLPEDLRAAPSLQKFTDPGALAKSYTELETMVGRKGLVIPTEKDGPEVHARYRAALGIPEAPDGYALKAPEGAEAVWSEDNAKAFAAWSHELGLTPTQAQGVAERWAKLQVDGARAAAEGIEPDGRRMEDILREEWGASYDANVDVAKRAAKQFGADLAVLDALEAKVGGAALTKLFARIGAAISEDAPVGMGAPAGRMDPKAELAQLMAPGTPYWSPMHPEHRTTYERVKELHARLA